MVYGDNRPFNSAVVVPDAESLKGWAEEEGISAGDLSALLEHPKVQELIAAQLEEYSGDFKSFEKVKKFRLVAEDFSTENGLLTPSLKLKRRVAMERYGKLFESMY